MKKLIEILNKKYPEIKAVPSEDFDGRPGGIWLRGTEETIIDGSPILNLYADDPTESVYILSIHKKLHALLQQHNCYAEPYDGGTLMVWPG